MGQINLLWELQKHDIVLSDLKKKLDYLKKEIEIEELRIKLKQKEYDLINKRTQLDVNNVKIKRYDQKLKQLNFNKKEIEESLYSGRITNIKQLEKMEKEKEGLEEEIVKLETDIILLMEEVENLQIEIENIEYTFNNLKEKLEDALQKHEELTNYIITRIKDEEAIIQDMVQKIDDDLIKRYESLKLKKNKAIVEVCGDRCNGCHMAIPLSILSKLKNSDNVTYCDNCGRILYYNKYNQEETNE